MNLKKALYSILPEENVNLALGGYDIIGDIAIISLSPAYDYLENEIAQTILTANPRLRLVAKRVGSHCGEFRVTPLQKIGGSGNFLTVHKEFGLRLHVDTGKAYFSPRSGNERYRITKQVAANEHVLVLFSGLGPLVLMIGMHSDAAEIIGVEKNPRAHRLAQKNLEENRKIRNVGFVCGDVASVLPHLQKQFDRIIMPHPLAAKNYLPLALRYLSPRGMLHFYDFQYKDEFDLSLLALQAACKEKRRRVSRATIHQCGHIGSRRYRVCVDARID